MWGGAGAAALRRLCLFGLLALFPGHAADSSGAGTMTHPLEPVNARLREAERLGLRIKGWVFDSMEMYAFWALYDVPPPEPGWRYVYRGIPIVRVIDVRARA